MNLYQQRALEGASGAELTVALYDGIIRFMREAAAAVDRDDVPARRRAVKRAMDILIHLQATLRMDIGGKTAESLAEFYAATFALLLQGSTECSKEKLEKAVTHVWEVREAWRTVAADPDLRDKTAAQMLRLEPSAGVKPPQGTSVNAEREPTSAWWA